MNDVYLKSNNNLNSMCVPPGVVFPSSQPSEPSSYPFPHWARMQLPAVFTYYPLAA